MPIQLPRDPNNRNINDRDINILIHKILDLTEYINSIIVHNPQDDPDRDAQVYLVYASRLLINRVYNFADRHGFMLADEYVARPNIFT
jgi:hypothetical protein